MLKKACILISIAIFTDRHSVWYLLRTCIESGKTGSKLGKNQGNIRENDFPDLANTLKKTNILKFIRPSPNSVYNCHNPKGLKFIIRFRLGLSHLREHKIKYSFQDTFRPLCNCGVNIESTEHFLLHCKRCILLITIGNINYKLLENTDSDLSQGYFLEIHHLT